MKKPLVEIVKDILSDMDSEDVNSISDSEEAGQIASVIEATFNNIVATREIPEHKQLLRLTSFSDSSKPTHFTIQTNVKRIETIWYNVGNGSEVEYREIEWKNPLEFLDITDRVSDYVSVEDVTTFRIRNTSQPHYYTSFDDTTIIMDSFDADIDSHLQESKTRAIGVIVPVFSKEDTYIPDLDIPMFQYMVNEAKSTCFDLFKGGISQKIEQNARRQKAYVQNDKHKLKEPRKLSNYGRT